MLSRCSLSLRSGEIALERHRQGTSLPNSGSPGGTSFSRKPAPLQMGQTASSCRGSSLSLEEVGVFAPEVL